MRPSLTLIVMDCIGIAFRLFSNAMLHPCYGFRTNAMDRSERSYSTMVATLGMVTEPEAHQRPGLPLQAIDTAPEEIPTPLQRA